MATQQQQQQQQPQQQQQLSPEHKDGNVNDDGRLPEVPSPLPPAGAGGPGISLQTRLSVLGITMWTISALVVITIMAIFIYLLHYQLPRANDLMLANRGLQRSHEDMLNMETGLRGYIVIREAVFLEPYYTAAKNLPIDSNYTMQHLQLANVPELMVSFAQLNQVRDHWLNDWANVVVDSPSYWQNMTREALLEFMLQGKNIMDQNRQVYTVVQRTLDDVRTQDLDTLRNILLPLCILIGIGSLVTGLCACWLKRSFRRPFMPIFARLSEMANGDFTQKDLHLTSDAPTEVLQLADYLNLIAVAFQREAENIKLKERLAATSWSAWALLNPSISSSGSTSTGSSSSGTTRASRVSDPTR